MRKVLRDARELIQIFHFQYESERCGSYVLNPICVIKAHQDAIILFIKPFFDYFGHFVTVVVKVPQQPPQVLGTVTVGVLVGQQTPAQPTVVVSKSSQSQIKSGHKIGR